MAEFTNIQLNETDTPLTVHFVGGGSLNPDEINFGEHGVTTLVSVVDGPNTHSTTRFHPWSRVDYIDQTRTAAT